MSVKTRLCFRGVIIINMEPNNSLIKMAFSVIVECRLYSTNGEQYWALKFHLKLNDQAQLGGMILVVYLNVDSTVGA